MNDFRFGLDNRRPSKLFYCPRCGKRELKRYLDNESGEYMLDHVGRCNREVNCGYHFTPRQYFVENPKQELIRAKINIYQHGATQSNIYQHNATQSNVLKSVQPNLQGKDIQEDLFSQIPVSILLKSLSKEHFVKNNFLQYLSEKFGEAKMEILAKRFHIGTSSHWTGATVFWQVDNHNKLRTGKVMLFDRHTGKRIKKPFNHINWVHTLLIKQGIFNEYNLDQCLFGVHQIIEHPYREVAIVESEKTAIIASLYLPEFTWMACGGLSNLSPIRLKALYNMRIVLYPDLNCFEKWEKKAKELRKVGFRLVVSDVLEKASFVTEEDRIQGLDIEDYLTRIKIAKSPIERMIEKYPNVQQLIERLDLKVIEP